MNKTPKVVTLVVEDNMVECQETGSREAVTRCSKCTFARTQQLTSSASIEDAYEGIVVCTFGKTL